VFTVHNLGYQGNFHHTEYLLTGLPWDLYTPAGLEFYGNFNCLKGGLVFSDWITTVSPTYSREIRSSEQGFGLDGVLAERKERVTGILNGIDDQEWNPETDPHLSVRFGPGRMTGKARCKADLQKQFGLPRKKDAPLIGIISRLVDQKGFDLIGEILDPLMKMDLQMTVLGTGTRNHEEMLIRAARTYPDRIGVRIGFDNSLAHKIEGGADLFLMPSRYDPCGLNQMYSLRYGTIPVVRATGGLNDTIKEFNPAWGTGNGFKFKSYSPRGLLIAVKRAVHIYGQKKDWDRLVQNGMREDFSWGRSARAYSRLYRKASALRARETKGVPIP
jgi:starch synthase